MIYDELRTLEQRNSKSEELCDDCQDKVRYYVPP